MDIYYFIAGVLIFLYCYFFKPHIIRIDWLVVAKFLAWMVLITAIRFAIMSVKYQPMTVQVSFTMLPLVFWEDAFFAIPIYWAKDYLKLKKWLWIPLVVVLSVIFGLGHIQYSLPWAFITLFLPYFVSYKYGRIHGFGTVMICHIYYDFITLLSHKLFTVLSLPLF